jgi:glycosyltransferase involved in cell wall biosynthesis
MTGQLSAADCEVFVKLIEFFKLLRQNMRNPDIAGTHNQMSGGRSVSLIVPVYKDTWVLKHTLPRLAAQDYRGPLEIIVCDDGSCSGMLATIQGFIEQMNLRYVWQPHCGMRLARSRNNGLRCATGDIVIYLDGDVGVAPDFVSRHVAAHRFQPAIVCGTRRWLFAEDCGLEKVDSLITDILSNPQSVQQMHSEAIYQIHYARTTTPWMGCVGGNFSFYRRPDVFFDEAFVGWGCEDEEFACRLHCVHGYSVIIDTDLYGVHVDRGSRHNFDSLRPSTQDEIALLFSNIAHFADLYPQFGVSPICDDLGRFVFDPASGNWGRAEKRRSDPEHLTRLLAIARKWLASRGSTHKCS